MKDLHQLVLQFPCHSAQDFDAVVEIETELEGLLGDSADVDGHDVGSGEANIFVITAHPYETFKAARSLIEGRSMVVPGFKAAFRAVAGEEFTVLWPESSSEFSVI